MTHQAVKEENLTSPHFVFRTFAANSQKSDEVRVFALRYQVYCLERSFLPASDYPDGLENDGYDVYSTHVAAYSLSDVLVGSLRLVTPPDGHRFPFQDHCLNLFENRPQPPNHQCTEISRLVISKLYRRRVGDTVFGVSAQLMEEKPSPAVSYDRRKVQRAESDRRKMQPEILLGILRQVYRHSKLKGILYWYMALEKPLARLLERLFYFSLEPIGEQTDYYGPVIPCILSMDHFDRALSHNDPTLFAWFQDALEKG